MKRSPFVILDRDGVINEDSDAYIKSVDEWQPLPGSLEAVAMLNQAGYQVFVLTNQSGLSRGLFEESELDRMHQKMRDLLAEAGGHIADILYCPHGPEMGCDCRKPNTGLFTSLARKHNLNLSGIPVVGDSMRDLQAALAVSATPMLVETGKGQRTLKQYPNLDYPTFPDLHAAAQYIIFNKL